MVVYLATIMGISDEYYDAAKVDGANIFQQIWYITVPLLKPTFIILLLYALGGIMKGQFELFYQTVGNNGVLYDVTDILDTYVYRVTTTQPLSMGLSAAAGLYQSVFGLVIVDSDQLVYQTQQCGICTVLSAEGGRNMADKKHNRIRKDSVMIAFDVIKYILLTITSLLCVLPSS